MKTTRQDEQTHVSSLNEPLIVHHTDEKLLGNIEANNIRDDDDDDSGNNPFFKTCFNGLNALSGSFFFLSQSCLIYLIIIIVE